MMILLRRKVYSIFLNKCMIELMLQLLLRLDLSLSVYHHVILLSNKLNTSTIFLKMEFIA